MLSEQSWQQGSTCCFLHPAGSPLRMLIARWYLGMLLLRGCGQTPESQSDSPSSRNWWATQSWATKHVWPSLISSIYLCMYELHYFIPVHISTAEITHVLLSCLQDLDFYQLEQMSTNMVESSRSRMSVSSSFKGLIQVDVHVLFQHSVWCICRLKCATNRENTMHNLTIHELQKVTWQCFRRHKKDWPS